MDPRIESLPQKPPFRFLDEIVAMEEGRVVACWTPSAQEPFFAGHFPGLPIVPGVLLCEFSLQAASLLMADAGARISVVSRLKDARFRSPVRPGERLEVEVQRLAQVKDAAEFKAAISCGGRRVAELAFLCMSVARERVAGQ